MINVFEPKKQYISNKKLILRNIKKVLERHDLREELNNLSREST